MQRVLMVALCAGVLTLGMAGSANAGLISRLGGLAYYDDVLDITWLADANAGAGSVFDDGASGTDGKMSWGSAGAWAASLNVAGIGGWRLTTLSPVDGAAFDNSVSYDATTDHGYAGSAGWVDAAGTPVSEMGYMYYVNLGNLGYCNPGIVTYCVVQGGGWGLGHVAPFANIHRDYYWSGVASATGPHVWGFGFRYGNQGQLNAAAEWYAWAVRSGDVLASAPEPDALMLLGTGLIGFLWRNRKSPGIRRQLA